MKKATYISLICCKEFVLKSGKTEKPTIMSENYLVTFYLDNQVCLDIGVVDSLFINFGVDDHLLSLKWSKI